MVRGALHAGLQFGALEEALAQAALAHYNDFGHSLIYLRACADLVARFGGEVEMPLLCAYVRSLVRATREDLIPEFRAYVPALEQWNNHGEASGTPPDTQLLVTSSIKGALATTLAARGAAPIAVFHALLGAAAIQLLRFDPIYER